MTVATAETVLERLAAAQEQDAPADELLDLADEAIDAAIAARNPDALDRIVALLEAPAAGAGARGLLVAAARAKAALSVMPPRASAAVEAPTYASWSRRAVGFLVDWIVITVALLVFTLIASSDDLIVVVWLAGPPLYFAAQHAVYAQTIGKWVVGTIVTGLDGAPVRPAAAFGRTLVQVLLSLVPLVIFADLLWPLWDEHRQTLHDKLAHTLVLH